MKRKNKTK